MSDVSKSVSPSLKPGGLATEFVSLMWLALSALALVLLSMSSVSAQDLETFDPDEAFSQSEQDSGAIDADLVAPSETIPQSGAPTPTPTPPLPVPPAKPVPVPTGDPATDGSTFEDEFATYSQKPAEGEMPKWVDPESGVTLGEKAASGDTGALANAPSYGEDDLIGAAEGVFGKGAKGLAKLIEDLLKKEGRPNAYIVGREAGGAFVVGARYGSGTLHHKIEGERKVYWTGPSVGLDAGANAANTFVLVYNLYDSEDLFKRYPAGEGQAYFVGGLHASYMRRGDVVLIPIRLGAGVRLGVNAGYMKFSKKQRWLPF